MKTHLSVSPAVTFIATSQHAGALMHGSKGNDPVENQFWPTGSGPDLAASGTGVKTVDVRRSRWRSSRTDCGSESDHV